ncbi:GntR family transcriptional regulator [Gymnodinialimonas hymeniacidonis]|uniref:GntR family transcriptional regulator n=1 Tax=Gymnodinialimonas hymeniacidonis TaxID=3126508 RepID=UPI0034C5E608
MAADHLSPRNRKAALADHLRAGILTLEYHPGSDLDEVAICERFGLSRTPVREVFRDLDGAGFVELRENKGARVAALSHTTLRDFFLVAPMIYSAILRMAAGNATAAQIKDLKAAQNAFTAALRQGSAAERALTNSRFHEITGEMSGSVYLIPSFQRLLIDHARIGMTFYQPKNQQMADNLAKASEHHDQIIAAIEAGDEDAAAALAEAHWALSRDEIGRFVLPAPLDLGLGDDIAGGGAS